MRKEKTHLEVCFLLNGIYCSGGLICKSALLMYASDIDLSST